MVPDANEAETSELGAKLQRELTPTLRAWRLYLSRETIKEGSGVGMILITPDSKTCSYAIRLNFNAPKHIMNYEALLAGLVASAGKATEQERRYREEIMDATTPFHRFWITHLPKILNSKAEMLTGLATIQLEFLNQEVSMGIKTRPTVEMGSDEKEGRATGKMPMGKPNYNWETSGSN
ncbi:hypothetical protein Tco_1296826 [Tanacetum coccineum]